MIKQIAEKGYRETVECLLRGRNKGPIRSSALAGEVEGRMGSTGRIVDEFELLLARRAPPRAQRLRRLGGRGRFNGTQRAIASVAGGVSHTDLGRGGGGGSVVDVVLLTTGNVVAECGRLVLVRHRVETREGVESRRNSVEDRENIPAISAILIPISNPGRS